MDSIEDGELKDNLQNLQNSFMDYNNEKLKEEQNKVHQGKMQNEYLRRRLVSAEETIDSNKCKDDTRNLLNKLNNNIDMLDKLSELFQLKFNNINGSIKDINDITKNNTRRVMFENEKNSLFKRIMPYIRLVYYLILIMWIIFGDFLTKQKYYSVGYWLLIITYLLIPLKLGTIVNLIYYIFYNIYKFIRIFLFQTMPSTFMFSS